MAERRIAEKTGQGVVCFISNYSWLDGLSFTGMRERYLEAFDAIRIDCLNGDKYKTGKVTPDGRPRPEHFFHAKRPGGDSGGDGHCDAGRKADHTPAETVGFRHLWGRRSEKNWWRRRRQSRRRSMMMSSPCYRWGCHLCERRLGRSISTGPRYPNCFQCRFRGSIPRVTVSRRY